MIWLLSCSELLPSLKDAALSQNTDSPRALRAVSPAEPSLLQTSSEAMRASGGLMEIAACLGRNDQCVNRFKGSRMSLRSQVFGGMELADL